MKKFCYHKHRHIQGTVKHLKLELLPKIFIDLNLLASVLTVLLLPDLPLLIIRLVSLLFHMFYFFHIVLFIGGSFSGNLRKTSLRNNCPYSELLWSFFSPNTGKYGPELLRIRTLFTHCPFYFEIATGFVIRFNYEKTLFSRFRFFA